MATATATAQIRKSALRRDEAGTPELQRPGPGSNLRSGTPSARSARDGRSSPYSAANAFLIMASDGSGPLNPTRYSSRIGAKHS